MMQLFHGFTARLALISTVFEKNTRAPLSQVSDQRGTCLVERLARGWPVSIIRTLSYSKCASQFGGISNNNVEVSPV